MLHALRAVDAFYGHLIGGAAAALLATFALRSRIQRWLWPLHTPDRACGLAALAALSVAVLLYVEVVVLAGIGAGEDAMWPPPPMQMALPLPPPLPRRSLLR